MEKQNLSSIERSRNIPELRFSEFTEEWEEKKLREITSVERGKFTPRPRNNPIYYNGEIPFVQTGDVVHSKGIINTHSQTLNEKGLKVSKLFKKGDLLITVAANIGYAGVLQYDMACPDSLIGLKCTSKINNYFLNYLLEIEQPKMDYLAVAAAQKNINIEFLKPYKFSIPTPTEQTKIATFLTAVDKRINLLQKKKAELEQYKKGVMQKLFSQTLRFKKDDGSDFEDWEEKKLGEVCKVQGGFAFKSSNFKKSGIPVIRISNISNTNNFIDISNMVFYDEIENAENYIIHNGDLLIAMSGATTGKTSIYNLEEFSYVNQRVGLFKPISVNLFYPFITQYVLSVGFEKQLSLLLVAGAQPNISSNDIESIKIPFPEKEEQKSITIFLSSIDKSIENITNQIDDSEMFKKGLLQKMFV